MSSRLVEALCAAGLAASALPAGAVAIAQPDTTPVWGRPLDVKLKVSGLSDAEALPECFAVDVLDGETSVPPMQVHTTLLPAGSGVAGERWLRVRTSGALHEPVVTLHVEARCQGRFVRTVTLLPEPARLEPAPGTGTAMAAAPERSDGPAQWSSLEPTAAGTSAPTPAPASTVAPAAMPDPTPVRARTAARSPARAPSTTASARPKAARVAAARGPAGSRLTMSAPELALGLAGAGAQAVKATFTPVSVMDAALPRADEALRREVARLGDMVRSQQSVIQRLEAREPTRTVQLDGLVAAGGAAAALAAGYFFLRMRRLQRSRAPWWDSSVMAYLDETEAAARRR